MNLVTYDAGTKVLQVRSMISGHPILTLPEVPEDLGIPLLAAVQIIFNEGKDVGRSSVMRRTRAFLDSIEE